MVLPIATAMYGSRLLPQARLGAQFLRTRWLVTAMTLYFFALSQIPLATAASAYFVGPILAASLLCCWGRA